MAAQTSMSSATTCSMRSTSTTTGTGLLTSSINSSSQLPCVIRPTSYTTSDRSRALTAPTGTGSRPIPCRGSICPKGGPTVLGTNLPCPPCNIGPLSTPNYAALAGQAVSRVGDGILSFAGQRAEGFYVDLGAIFDLGNLRPFQGDHAGWSGTGLPAMAAGVNSTDKVNVHSLALQIPISQLMPWQWQHNQSSVIGVWTTASRQKVKIYEGPSGAIFNSGPYVQVSRLGNPLFNEVLIPISLKDAWNGQSPSGDKDFAQYVSAPQLGSLLPSLFPGVFPNLAAFNATQAARADLLAILLTGIPSTVVPGFAGNYTGATQADMLRLNMSIPPTPPQKFSNLGLIGGDVAGFPNGRRVQDDVATIELRAIAGATLPLVDPAYVPDSAAGSNFDGPHFGPNGHVGDGEGELSPELPVPWDAPQRVRRSHARRPVELRSRWPPHSIKSDMAIVILTARRNVLDRATPVRLYSTSGPAPGPPSFSRQPT